MVREEAIAAFVTLEAMTVKVEGDPDATDPADHDDRLEPLWDVRMDATSEDTREGVERRWRIRASYSKTVFGDDGGYDIRKIIDMAEEAELRIVVQNGGFELH